MFHLNDHCLFHAAFVICRFHIFLFYLFIFLHLFSFFLLSFYKSTLLNFRIFIKQLHANFSSGWQHPLRIKCNFIGMKTLYYRATLHTLFFFFQNISLTFENGKHFFNVFFITVSKKWQE